jgi:hypothetical protein
MQNGIKKIQPLSLPSNPRVSLHLARSAAELTENARVTSPTFDKLDEEDRLFVAGPLIFHKTRQKPQTSCDTKEYSPNVYFEVMTERCRALPTRLAGEGRIVDAEIIDHVTSAG